MVAKKNIQASFMITCLWFGYKRKENEIKSRRRKLQDFFCGTFAFFFLCAEKNKLQNYVTPIVAYILCGSNFEYCPTSYNPKNKLPALTFAPHA